MRYFADPFFVGPIRLAETKEDSCIFFRKRIKGPRHLPRELLRVLAWLARVGEPRRRKPVGTQLIAQIWNLLLADCRSLRRFRLEYINTLFVFVVSDLIVSDQRSLCLSLLLSVVTEQRHLFSN